MQTLKLLAQLLPILIQLIKAAEAAIPESGQGAAKLALVREILESADDAIPAIWPTVERVIGALVRAFNLAGAFGK